MEYLSRRIREARRFEGMPLPPEVARQLLLLKLAGAAPAPDNAKAQGFETYFLSAARNDWERAVMSRENGALEFSVPDTNAAKAEVVDDQKRHAGTLLEEAHFLIEPVLAHVVAVVAREDHDRVVGEAVSIERIEHAAHAFIHALDHGRVFRRELFPVPGEELPQRHREHGGDAGARGLGHGPRSDLGDEL